MTRDWEIRMQKTIASGSTCELDPKADEWLLFSPHNLDTGYFVTTEETDQSHGGNWDARLHFTLSCWIMDCRY